MFSKILVANRGEIACRVMKTARRMGIKTVAVYSDSDRQALHLAMADEAVHIGGSPSSESYLRGDRIIKACRDTEAEAVHPGYGFLSENAEFCTDLEQAGITFIGPPAKAIAAMGDKITSKKIAVDAGVSTVPGHMGLVEDAAQAARISDALGYPVMIKASAGGGGKGMRIAWNGDEAREGFERARSEAASGFGDDRIFIEKFITDPRHIEIQVLADKHGNCLSLGERECSIQRRHQKVIEEAPSPFLDPVTRAAMGEQSRALARAVGYTGAGTVEFVVDGDRNFYFLEMNTRLQVEHPVTELVTGIDLVEHMIRVAAGEKLSFDADDISSNGWAIEARLYAEDPYRNFLPSSGRLTRYRPPRETASGTRVVRNDTGVFEGAEISTFYDPMIAKLCTWAPSREEAITAMSEALDGYDIEGIGHNIPFLSVIMEQARFRQGRLTTAYIAEEFPDGFKGATLSDAQMFDMLGCAFMLQYVSEEHFTHARPRRRTDDDESRRSCEWTVVVDKRHYVVRGHRDDPAGVWNLSCLDRERVAERFDWKPGETCARIDWQDGQSVCIKVTPVTGGFRVRYRGADFRMQVLLPHVADLLIHMPAKLPPDMSRYLSCPMPGQVVQVEVAVGDIVEIGQPLVIIEAMKMENVLRAERQAVVKTIEVDEGSVLAVHDVIMEFEAHES